MRKVTILEDKGKTGPGGKFLKEYHFNEGIKEIRDGHGKIPGLRCPDCGSQAFKTDQKDVAVCGDCPGWYFYYRIEEDEKTHKPKTKVEIVGEEYKQVPIYHTKVLMKSHG